jgi:hypothetical protein
MKLDQLEKEGLRQHPLCRLREQCGGVAVLEMYDINYLDAQRGLNSIVFNYKKL